MATNVSDAYKSCFNVEYIMLLLTTVLAGT